MSGRVLPGPSIEARRASKTLKRRAKAEAAERERYERELLHLRQRNHELEEALRTRDERNRDLEEALRARDEFLGILGHELRNPLSPIFLQVGFLADQVKSAKGGVVSSEWLLPQLETFSKRLHRLLDVLTRLMEVAKIGAGRVPLHLEEMDLTDVVREICAGSERELAAAKCTLELHAPVPVVGRWDRVRLEQIFRNLLSNAMRYGAGRRIDVAVSGEGDGVRLTVQDRGIGISREDQVRIFERFERGGEEHRHRGGFGLGLWVTQKLCEAMGGSIAVESELGRGSTFVVSLPRHTQEIP